jgi:thioredoxin 1
MTAPYASTQPSREHVDGLPGAAVVQFGTNACGYCIAAEPLIEQALSARPDVQRLKVEDGSGRALGRSFRVKLWPTLIFLQDGREVARVVRPRSELELQQALAQLQQ